MQHIDCDFSLYPPLANQPVKNTFIGNIKVIYSVVRDIYFVFLLYWKPLLTSSLALNFLWRICDLRIRKCKWWFCSYLRSHQFLQSELWQASLLGVVLNIKNVFCHFFLFCCHKMPRNLRCQRNLWGQLTCSSHQAHSQCLAVFYSEQKQSYSRWALGITF